MRDFITDVNTASQAETNFSTVAAPKPEETNSVLSTALWLCEHGFTPHWLRSHSKAPVGSGWSTAPVMTADELVNTYQPGYNLGIRLGHWSRPAPGYGLVAIDIDIREPAARGDPFEVLYRWY